MVERKGVHRLNFRSKDNVDVVPAAALVLGVASFVAPFAALKENRVVDGILVTGAGIAGVGLGAAALLCGLAVAAAAFLAVDQRRRSWVYAVVGAACFWMTAGLLARAGTMLPEGAAPRVSPALGFWGLPAASYVLIDHSKLAKGRGRGVLLALILLVPAAMILSGGRGESISVFREWSGRKNRFLDESLVHLKLFASAVAAAAIIGIPLGIAASRDKKIGGPVIAFVDAAQTIPSMALFGLLMAPLAALSRAVPALRAIGVRGIGAAPALIALALYALLPIVRNTVIGIASVPISAYEAGRGIGMSPKQLFWKVEWPMALPHVLTGLRTASVQAVGNTAVAALIGAGGLGMMIFQGLGQAAPDLVLLGVIPLILLAIAVDRIWGVILHRAVSRGLQVEGASA